MMSRVAREIISLEEYGAIHYWLKKHYGKADMCENKNCTRDSKKYEWALKTGEKYDRKRSSFMKLCKRCHAKMDVTDSFRKKMSILRKGKRLPKTAYTIFKERYTGVPRPEWVRQKIRDTLLLKHYEVDCIKCGSKTKSSKGVCKKCYMHDYLKIYRLSHPNP